MLVKIAHQLTILISSQNTVKKFKRLASKTRLKMRKVQTVPRRKDHQAFNAVMMIVMKMLISLINFNRSIATKKILVKKRSYHKNLRNPLTFQLITQENWKPIKKRIVQKTNLKECCILRNFLLNQINYKKTREVAFCWRTAFKHKLKTLS